MYLKPRNGSLLLLNTAKVRHGTIRNSGFSQIGCAMATKDVVLKQCKNHMQKLQKISDAILNLADRTKFDELL